MRTIACLLLLGLFSACSSGGNNGSPDIEASKDLSTPPDLTPSGDLSTADLASSLLSACGHPGDVGNALGVGKFCMTLDDCSANTKATICSAIGNGGMPSAMDTYFCTFQCQMGVTDCGAMATCKCNNLGCGCTPSSCM